MRKAVPLLFLLLSFLLSSCNGAGATVQTEEDHKEQTQTFAGIREEDSETGITQEMKYSSWEEVPVNGYREETITTTYEGQKIWGIAYIPDLGRERYPLVICSHGLGGSYTSCMEYAGLLASHGFSTYCFDFRGGGGNRSDGSLTEMSLMTEAADVLSIIEESKSWSFVDPEKIILLGESQGGAASAIAAARNTRDVSGLILCYPALLVHDSVHEEFGSLEEVPDSFFFKWLTVGRPYAEDVWDYDIYAEIGIYTKPVLLMHGDRDDIVPIFYAERAAEVYPDVQYHVIHGGGHGFYGDALAEAVNYILEYLQQIQMIQ